MNALQASHDHTGHGPALRCPAPSFGKSLSVAGKPYLPLGRAAVVPTPCHARRRLARCDTESIQQFHTATAERDDSAAPARRKTTAATEPDFIWPIYPRQQSPPNASMQRQVSASTGRLTVSSQLFAPQRSGWTRGFQ